MKNDKIYINVALPNALTELFTYSINKDEWDETLVGRRVGVGFGNKKLTGFIVSRDSRTEFDFEVKSISEILDERPVFSDELLRLAKWIADYYLAPIGDTLRAMLPQGMTPKSNIRISINPSAFEMDLSALFKKAKTQKKVFDFLRQHDKAVSIQFLQKSLKLQSAYSIVNQMEKQGLVLVEKTESEHVKQKSVRYLALNNQFFNNDTLFNSTYEILERKAPRQKELLEFLFLNYDQNIIEIPLTRLSDDYPISAIRALEKRNVFNIIQKSVNRNDLQFGESSLAKRNEINLELTEEQSGAVSALTMALDSGENSTFLLDGVTGSGKTLVYLHAINHCLEIGKTCIMLVPEISLTPQLIDRFNKSFPSKIAVFHSRMSEGERYDAWQSLYNGEKQIVIGARSAVFAPLENIGLVIVDEEHESSYKQDSPNPRYNGRDVAIVRAKMNAAVVLLGSATPSIESKYNASIGRYKELRITRRADDAKMPTIIAVDTISAVKNAQMFGSISKLLLDKIIDRLNKKQGIIIFQNRRGFASFLECPDCAEIPVCKFCSVTLVYHKALDILRCHYCGYTAKAHRTCLRCGYPDMAQKGSGTQRIEDELAEQISIAGLSASIERMDLDTTSAKGSHRAMLERFASGKTDILVGTQMVAKGLDFDRVTLVGVVNADLQLFLPDFRAAERTFQLLSQVAGRAGRSGENLGEVVIQTAHPENYAVQYALNNDYQRFYSDEIIFRKNALYPPFARFCLIEFSDEDQTKVSDAAAFYANNLPRSSAFLMLGPVQPTLSRLMGRYRQIIVLKNIKSNDSNGNIIRSAIKRADSAFEKSPYKAVKYTVDIDSYSGI